MKTLTYEQRLKLENVELMKVNIPVGTEFEIYTIGFRGMERVRSRGIVVGHTKSGNIKLETSAGTKFKTKYHFQMNSKESTFYVVGSCTNWCRFL